MTVIVTSILLRQQTETESHKDKDIRIYEQKIKVYSEFVEKMWAMFDDNKITEEEFKEKLKELRKICFKQLVFFHVIIILLRE
jgi:ribosomal protein L16 Arg81 hydroxylase